MEYALIEHVHKKDVGLLPKIIDDARDAILDEARRQILEHGPKKMTIRSVAAKCGVATGTIYNYFPNKEMLVASVILQDWMVSLENMKNECLNASSIVSGLEVVYSEIKGFLMLYDHIFKETGVPVAVKYTYINRHNLLCSQISGVLNELYSRFDNPQNEDMLIFLSECLLNCAVRKRDFSFLKNIFIKLM